MPDELPSAIDGRASWLLWEVITQLRDHDDLVNILLDGDEQAIFAGMPPERNDRPLAIPTSIIFSGSDHNRDDLDVRYLIQVSVVTSADYYDSWGSWGMSDALDCAAEAFDRPWPPDVSPPTGEGGSNNIQVTDSAERVMFGRWQTSRHIASSH